MKHAIRRLALVLALVLALSAASAATSFDGCAHELSRIGMFRGTGEDWKGYALERAPTRAEAAVMLVRMLGQEQAALALSYTAPFTDVPAWAQPYVQYLHANGLASGTTATTYSPQGACTAREFTTLLLRAMGYSEEKGDFTAETVMAFAAEKGLVNNVNCDEANFLRDHMVAMTYTALSLRTSAEDPDLLSTLVRAGAVAPDGAAYTLMRFSHYREYTELVALAQAQTGAHQTLSINIMTRLARSGDVPMDLGTLTLDLNTDFAAKNGPTLSAVGKFAPGKDGAAYPAGDVAFYCADGYFYWSAAGLQQKLPFDLSAFLAELERVAPNGLPPVCMTSNAGGSEGDGGAKSRSFSILFDVFNTLLQQALTDGLLPKFADDLRGEIISLSVQANGKTFDQTMSTVCVSVPHVDEFLSASIPDYDGRTLISFYTTQTNAPGAAKVSLPSDLSAYTLYTAK